MKVSRGFCEAGAIEKPPRWESRTNRAGNIHAKRKGALRAAFQLSDRSALVRVRWMIYDAIRDIGQTPRLNAHGTQCYPRQTPRPLVPGLCARLQTIEDTKRS